MRAAGDGQVVLLPDPDDIEAAAKLAMARQHPLPDCLYLAAAERLGAAMITAYRALVSRANGRSDLVQLLAELSG